MRLEFDDLIFSISGGGGVVTKAEISKPNKSYFSIPTKTVTSGTPHTMEIEINCIQEVTEVASIKAFSVVKNTTTNVDVEKLAGKLLIKANNKANRKQKKIVLVNVLTSLAPAGGNTSGQEDVLKNAMRQALINPLTKTIDLDLSTESSFNKYLHTLPGTGVAATATTIASPPVKVLRGYFDYDYVNARDNSRKPAIWKDLWEHLNERLIAKKGNIYNSYIKVYYFGSRGGSVDLSGNVKYLNGYSQPGQKTTILFSTYDVNGTTAHEVLHSMGLDHTFESKNIVSPGRTTTDAPNGTYTFKKGTTDNIMDYAYGRKSLMEWQWDIIKISAQSES